MICDVNSIHSNLTTFPSFLQEVWKSQPANNISTFACRASESVVDRRVAFCVTERNKNPPHVPNSTAMAPLKVPGRGVIHVAKVIQLCCDVFQNRERLVYILILDQVRMTEIEVRSTQTCCMTRNAFNWRIKDYYWDIYICFIYKLFLNTHMFISCRIILSLNVNSLICPITTVAKLKVDVTAESWRFMYTIQSLH